MALQYRITKGKNKIQEGNELYIMQTIHTGNIDTEELSEINSSESNLSEADIKAVLHSIGKNIPFYLQQGKVINLDFIGKFKMGFQCEAADDPSKLKSPKSIKKFQINYQLTAKMKRSLKNGFLFVERGTREKIFFYRVFTQFVIGMMITLRKLVF